MGTNLSQLADMIRQSRRKNHGLARIRVSPEVFANLEKEKGSPCPDRSFDLLGVKIAADPTLGRNHPIGVDYAATPPAAPAPQVPVEGVSLPTWEALVAAINQDPEGFLRHMPAKVLHSIEKAISGKQAASQVDVAPARRMRAID